MALLQYGSIAGRAFIAHGAEIAEQIALREVQLIAVAPFMEELANCAHLVHVESLNLDGNRIGTDGIRALASSPYLTKLRRLNLARNSLGLDGLRALLRAPWLPQLQALSLAENDLDGNAIAEFLGDPATACLAELDLGRNPLGTLFANRWSEDRGPYRRYRSLVLAQTQLNAGELDTFFAMHSASLCNLDLSFNTLGATGAAAIARAHWPLLQSLNLSFTDLEDQGAIELASASSLRAVRRLILRGNRISSPGAVSLTTGHALHPDCAIDFAANRLDDAGRLGGVSDRMPAGTAA